MTLLQILALVAAVVAAIVITGLLIPREHTCTRRARFSRSPEELYTTITDWRALPSWRKDLTSVRALEGKSGWVEVSRFGELPLETIESVPGKKHVGRIASERLPFGGTWTFVIERDGDGSTLAITEDGFIKSLLFRVLARFVFGYDKTMEQYLKALGRKFGEEVSVRA